MCFQFISHNVFFVHTHRTLHTHDNRTLCVKIITTLILFTKVQQLIIDIPINTTRNYNLAAEITAGSNRRQLPKGLRVSAEIDTPPNIQRHELHLKKHREAASGQTDSWNGRLVLGELHWMVECVEVCVKGTCSLTDGCTRARGSVPVNVISSSN